MKFLVLLISIGLIAAVSGGSPLPGIVSADIAGIEVIEQGAESKFPEGIRFYLTAKSPDVINDIRVFIRKLGRITSSSYRTVEFPVGQLVSGESLLATGTGSNHVPPGTTMEYFFEVRDRGGRVHRTESQSFTYQDNRFEWLTTSEGLITVYYHAQFMASQARSTLDAASEALVRMGPVLGAAPTGPLRIVLYNSYRQMSAALPFRAQAVREKLLTQGMAFTDERVLLVHGADPSFRGTVSHEFTHLLVAEATGGANSQVPAWLNEGLAEYGNVDPTNQYDSALRFGIVTSRLKPLRFLVSFGGEPNDILIAYGQGRAVVKYLIDTYGNAKMADLMRVFQETKNIDQALDRVYGFDQNGLDSQWRATLGLDPAPPARELDRQPQEPSEAAPKPTPGPTLIPTPSTESAPPAAPAPDSTPMPPAADSVKNGKGPQPTSGCSAADPGRRGGAPPDLASLILLGGPLAIVWGRAVRHKRRPGSTRARVEGVIHRVPQQVESEQQHR